MVSQPLLPLDLTQTPLEKCNRDTQSSRTQLLAPSCIVLCFSFALPRCSGFLFPYLPGQPPRDRFRARWAQDEHIGTPTQATSEQFPLQLCLSLCVQHATNGTLLAVGDVGLPSISEHEIHWIHVYVGRCWVCKSLCRFNRAAKKPRGAFLVVHRGRGEVLQHVLL